MAIFEIKTYPDPVLRKKSRPLESVGEEENNLIKEMVRIMRAEGGMGLAAPQVGVSKRIIVVDAEEGLLKMVNPEILARQGASVLEEGCLSIPETRVEIKRADELSVSYIDESMRRLVKGFKGLTARAIQHEIDHLDGKLIIDYLPWYKKIFPERGEVKCLQ